MTNIVSFELSANDEAYFKKQAGALASVNPEALQASVAQRLAELNGILAQVPYVPDFVAGFIDDLRLLHTMLCDESYELSEQTRPWILYALSYLVNPVDAIPDPVPMVGMLDDIVVVGWVCNQLRGEMKVYRDLHA